MPLFQKVQGAAAAGAAGAEKPEVAVVARKRSDSPSREDMDVIVRSWDQELNGLQHRGSSKQEKSAQEQRDPLAPPTARRLRVPEASSFKHDVLLQTLHRLVGPSRQGQARYDPSAALATMATPRPIPPKAFMALHPPPGSRARLS